MADPAAPPVPDSPAPDRPAAPRRAGRARVTHRVAAFVVAAAACGFLAWAGVWFTPFLAGLATGALSARWRRGVVLPAVAGAVAGWAFPIWVLALSGQPVGATARSIAALAGIPPYAGVTVFVVLLLAALQAFCGAWLARAVLPPGGRPPR
jgi:hypothetical protein